jgi:hypothetical protein
MHSAGLDSSAKLFEASFAQISHDITSACHAKKFLCLNRAIAPGIVSLADMSKRELLDAYATATDWLIFNDVGYTTRGGVAPEGSNTKVWDEVVKGLPDRTVLNSYRPEVSAIGNTITLLQRLYGIIWPILFLVAIVNFVTSLFSKARIHGLQLISLAAILGIIIFIGQLALLETSSGMYLTTGKTLYMLPAFPFIILAAVIELSTIYRFQTLPLRQSPA